MARKEKYTKPPSCGKGKHDWDIHKVAVDIINGRKIVIQHGICKICRATKREELKNPNSSTLGERYLN